MLDYGLHTVEYLNVGAQTEEEEGDVAVLDSVSVQVRGEEDAASTSIGSASEYRPSETGKLGDGNNNASNGSGSSDEGVGSGTIAGAVVGAVVGTALMAGLLWFIWWRRRKQVDAFSSHGTETPPPMPQEPFTRQRTDSEVPMAAATGSTLPGSQGGTSSVPSSRSLSGLPRTPMSFSVANPESTDLSSSAGPSSGAFRSDALLPGQDPLPSTPQEPPPMYSAQAAATAKGAFSQSQTRLADTGAQ